VAVCRRHVDRGRRLDGSWKPGDFEEVTWRAIIEAVIWVDADFNTHGFLLRRGQSTDPG
jgi:hypothetical protein